MLKWQPKVYWRDKEDGKLYINPIIAIGIIVAMMPLTWFILDTLTK